MHSSTKARIRFLNRIAHYDADLELVDVLSVAVRAGSLASSRHLFKGVQADRHPRLAARHSSKQGRQIAIGHLSNTVRASYIKDVYEDFSAYMAAILHGCARKGLNPDRLIGEHKFQVDVNQLLSLGSWDAVVEFVSATIFRKLENERSTKDLVTKIDSKLALGLDPAIRDAAMPFLDMRHMLVHRDGRADQEFCDTYPQFHLKAGDRIEVGYPMICDAKAAITALVDNVDSAVRSKGLVEPSELQ